MMQQVEQREYSCKPPVWLANLVKSREKKPVGNGEGKKRRFFEPEGSRSQRIMNGSQPDECKLAEGEQFRFVFHPNNVRDIRKPKKRNGEGICLRFHCAGHCFKDCRFSSGHGVLDKEELKELLKYMEECRNARAKFLTKRRSLGPKEGPNNEGEKGQTGTKKVSFD